MSFQVTACLQPLHGGNVSPSLSAICLEQLHPPWYMPDCPHFSPVLPMESKPPYINFGGYLVKAILLGNVQGLMAVFP